MRKRLYAIYKHPAGYEGEKMLFVSAEKEGQLQRGQLYVVEEVKMGNYSTLITLQGLPNRYKMLNSVAFNFFVMENNRVKTHDIFSDPEYNPYAQEL